MKLPLDGIKVIDFTQVMAGPFCTLLLGDLGAEIIKVEPEDGDYSRSTPPYFHKGDSLYYVSLNRNKKSIVVNLKQQDGKEIIYDLVKKSDVVVDNFRAGVMHKLGLNYEVLKKYNNKIISCSITGFGLNGPYCNRPAYDLMIQAMGGTMSFTGEPGQPPVRMGVPMGDLASGMFAVIGILSALNARNSFGMGQNIDISMLDCQIALLTYRAQYYLSAGEIPKPVGSGHVSSVPIRAFKTKDEWLVIDSGGDQFWPRLCKALDMKGLENDPRFNSRSQRLKNRDEVMKILEERFASKTREEWLKILADEGVPSGPVNNVAEALSDPSIIQRGMVVNVSRFGDEVKMIGCPVKMSETKCEKYMAAPALGENTKEILQEILNYTGEQINKLLKKRIIRIPKNY